MTSKTAPAATADSIVFSVMMALAAYLGRENPDFVYPEILYSFLTLLLFNLLNFSFLSRRLPHPQRAPSSVAINTFFISMAVYYSGGHSSNFWVMYLLPIFTACLAFDSRGIFLTTAGILALLAVFHEEALRERSLIDILALLVKAMTLLAAAGVTMRVAFNERLARKRLAEEQEHANQEQRRTSEQLQHMDRLATMGTLSASIAHELNSPLASILGFAQIGLDAPADHGTLREALRHIEHSARNCRQIIKDMLAFARSQKSERMETDVNALVQECVNLKKYDWVLTPLRVEEDYAADLPPLSFCVPEIQQVLFNLISNAEHAIAAKPGAGRITVRTRADEQRVRIEVHDDGSGIPLEVLGNIWDPFYTTKPAGKGTGLGLSISKQIVEEHGGRISARSIVGYGTCFTLEFPRPKAAGPSAAAQQQPAPEQAAAPGRADGVPAPAVKARRKVFVAEDDPSCIPLLKRLLTPYDFELRFSSDFNEMLTWMREDPPDLLVMDLRMPGSMCAAEFLARLDADARLRDTRILPISGSLQGSALEALLQGKGLQVLEKPFELDAFRTRLEETLKCSR